MWNSVISFILFYSVQYSNEIYLGDAASECGTSYYSEYDPFDYLYSCGTQYSDPVYEAVNRIDRTPMSPNKSSAYTPSGSFLHTDMNKSLEWMSQEDPLGDFMALSDTTAPPLPPRNQNQYSQPSIDRDDKPTVDRLKVATKLYEDVVVNKNFDSELVAFHNMVSHSMSPSLLWTSINFCFPISTG